MGVQDSVRTPKHNCKGGQYSSAKVHRSLKVEVKTDNPKAIDDYDVTVTPLEGLEAEIYEGRSYGIS